MDRMRRRRLGAALALTLLAWGSLGMAVLVGLNLAWGESLRVLGISKASWTPLARAAGLGWGVGVGACTWLLRHGLDAVIGFAQTHPAVATLVGPVAVGRVGAGVVAVLFAAGVVAFVLPLLARR